MFDYSSKDGVLWLYDDITKAGLGGIDAGAVIAALAKMPKKDITVRINSPGGDVGEGVAIYNALTRHRGQVTTINDALSASIANYIYMAGSIRLAAKNSLAMIHSPWTMALGNADEMRATADLLDKAESTIRDVYAAKTDREPEEIGDMMRAETWFTADEAVTASISTAVGNDLNEVEPIKIAASRFKNTPDCLKKELAAGSRHPFYRKRQHYEHLVQRTKAKYRIDNLG